MEPRSAGLLPDQITTDILAYKDEDGSPLVEKILDTAIKNHGQVDGSDGP